MGKVLFQSLDIVHFRNVATEYFKRALRVWLDNRYTVSISEKSFFYNEKKSEKHDEKI